MSRWLYNHAALPEPKCDGLVDDLMDRCFRTAHSMPLLLYRRFAKSGKFSGVVAADFSETMLQQARSYFKEDGTLGGSTPIALLRADVARLPFATGSLAAIHAGGDTRRCAAIEEGRSA